MPKSDLEENMRRLLILLLPALLLSCAKQKAMTLEDLKTEEVEKTLEIVEKEMKSEKQEQENAHNQDKKNREQNDKGDAIKGRKHYFKLCTPCHGQSGKGDGPAAASLPIKPTDHTNGEYMNKLSDERLFKTIKEGGAAVGKSPIMPGFRSSLGDDEIRDVIAYLRSIARPPFPGQ